MSNEGAYETKVMLESIHHLIYEALAEAEMLNYFSRFYGRLILQFVLERINFFRR